MTAEEVQQHQTKVQALLARYCRPRTPQQAMNLVLEDIRRAPGETLHQRRDRINRQREARLEVNARVRDRIAGEGPSRINDVMREMVTPTPAQEAAWDCANDGEHFDGMR